METGTEGRPCPHSRAACPVTGDPFDGVEMKRDLQCKGRGLGLTVVEGLQVASG